MYLLEMQRRGQLDCTGISIICTQEALRDVKRVAHGRGAFGEKGKIEGVERTGFDGYYRCHLDGSVSHAPGVLLFPWRVSLHEKPFVSTRFRIPDFAE